MSVWITAHAPPKDEYSTTMPIPMSTAGTVGTSSVALTTVPIANAWAPRMPEHRARDSTPVTMRAGLP